MGGAAQLIMAKISNDKLIRWTGIWTLAGHRVAVSMLCMSVSQWKPNSVEHIQEKFPIHPMWLVKWRLCPDGASLLLAVDWPGQWWWWGHRRSVDLTQDQCHLSSSPLQPGNRGTSTVINIASAYSAHTWLLYVDWTLHPHICCITFLVSGIFVNPGALFWQCRGAFWHNLLKLILKTFSWS